MAMTLKPLKNLVEAVKQAFTQHPPLPPERTLRLCVREDDICVLTFDRPGSSANIFDVRALDELSEELEFVARHPTLKGLIFTSAKPSIFIAGADLNLMREDIPLSEVEALIKRGQLVMNRIAELKIPTVAAIHGAAVGGGYELCLACDYRVASPDRSTKIGLPETKIGLLPGWGGSTRLPRLIGLPKALNIILGGKTVPAKRALKFGMVDELAPVEHLVEAAVRKIHAGKATRPNHWLTNNPLSVGWIAGRARREVMRRTRGNYPAVLKALKVITLGIVRSVEQSLALERDEFLELVQTKACHNLIRLFFLQEHARKSGLRADDSKGSVKPVVRTAVIGAGTMGAGIAQWLSARGLTVVLRDVNAEAVQKGMTRVAKLYRDGGRRGLFSLLEMRDGLDRVEPAPAEVPFSQVDVVVEAAVENLGLKKKIFQNLDELVSDEAILATNTSALPISEIAAVTRRPERVVGLHFFNPVHQMQLVEVVTTPQTSPEVLQRTVSFARKIGKLPVIVKDSPGFLVNRILMPYLIEAASLFEAGARLEDIDEVMLEFGMPMGPLRLVDEVGLDVALHVATTLADSFNRRMRIPDCLGKMNGQGMMGRKNGKGFYLHEKSKNIRPNPQALEFVRDKTARALPREELQERMVFLMANEAARCLEEGVVTDPADVDFAMVMGTGFAPFRGGPLRHTDAIGVARLVGAMEHLVANGAAHFTPCALLADMGAHGKKFYQS